ncbi:MAG: T9SS type A sorting domain-containing protein [Bacteroidales bacterium]|nr:T9SS type A sorting domain-containing protein [Bacteroidales bacterium]
MRKIYSILGALLMGATSLFAQTNYTVTFSANVEMEKVQVKNLSSGKTKMLYSPDNVITLQKVKKQETPIASVDNPMFLQQTANNEVIVNMEKAGHLNLTLYSSNGSFIARYSNNVEAGQNAFQIGASSGVYMLVASANNQTASLKILLTQSTQPGILEVLTDKVEPMLKSLDDVITFDEGDEFSFTGYYKKQTDKKTMVITEDTEIIFNFIPLPTVVTSNAENVTSSTATVGGNVTADNGASITERGICWSTSKNPTITDSKITRGTELGEFSIELTSLFDNTTYYARAYAINNAGPTYGNVITFTTSQITMPTVSTLNATNVSINAATVGGEVIADNGATIIERGICWSTETITPTIDDNKEMCGTGIGIFSVSLSSLAGGKQYYVRAYAINKAGIAYGNWIKFETERSIPSVSTVSVDETTIAGIVMARNGYYVTECGICWATTTEPTIGDNKITSSLVPFNKTDAEGLFYVKPLLPEGKYYIRAYATNDIGTAYGETIPFTAKISPVAIKNGAINAVFPISDSTQIYISQGNLQYQASNKVWRFAEHQYDIIGQSYGGGRVESSTGWIDLFGWGTSGWNSGAYCYQPKCYSDENSNYYPGGNYKNNLTGNYENADWGVYNKISNGGNKIKMWRTLTSDEWTNLLSYGTVNRGLGRVNNVNGLILLPPNCTALPSGLTFTPKYFSYDENIYTTEEWSKMESIGAVFLPAAHRGYSSDYGYYWSSSAYNNNQAYNLYFQHNDVDKADRSDRSKVCSVRLIQDYLNITTNATNVTNTTAIVSGKIQYPKASDITERGICWATTSKPTIDDNKKTCGKGTGSFSIELSSLSENTTYYARSYAVTTGGISYGEMVSFTTRTPCVFKEVPFSVSNSTKIYFSPGNLQYKANTNTWCFAPNQYDKIGDANANISNDYDGWIDLFGWGTSGWNSGASAYQPYSISTRAGDYCPGRDYQNNLTDEYANADWGVYNKISNGGNQVRMWRTLTSDEWTYLLYKRSDAKKLWGMGTVCGICGLILLPDDWSTPSAIKFTSNSPASIYTYAANVYSQEEWNVMQSFGAVFLPAAGEREGTVVDDSGIYVNFGGYGNFGGYWSSSWAFSNEAVHLYFSGYGVYMSGNSLGNRGLGRSVRLVRDVE